ncbi:LON peptidase substrate-binding domain-containing protein [uncultured Maricaulis sp.]|uniref:LON peptidase substrate-binding domain-containing protein n=1 Tax=uncultured Maricaulis sp. TaxID=174710 RepID=UPI0026105BBC|nr:LON peptidase substrate-binding domain-containing protein [uncultured Maricaulis sp.]
MTDFEDLPGRLPLFPLGGAILLPGEILPLNVFEPRYLNMVDDARNGSGHIGIIQSRSGSNPEKPELAPIGGAGRLKQWQETEDGRYLITLVGVSRFRVRREVAADKPYRVAEADYADFANDLLPRQITDADRDRLLGLLQAWFEAEQLAADWRTLREAPLPVLVDQLAMSAPFPAADRQALLEASNTTARLNLMQDLLAERIAGNAGGSMQ